ncbi:hypothetical protein V2J09_016382 [Rumex salicifolius]
MRYLLCLPKARENSKVAYLRVRKSPCRVETLSSSFHSKIAVTLVLKFEQIDLSSSEHHYYFEMKPIVQENDQLSSRDAHSKAAITASTTSWVVLLPPRSFVRYFPSDITFFTAVSSRSANDGN